MTRGFAPLPPGRGRGRGRGHEPPNSPLSDPTPLGPPTTTPMTSQGGAGGSFTLSPSPSSVSHPPAAPQDARKFITLAEAKDDRDFHNCISSVISGHLMEPCPSTKRSPNHRRISSLRS
ncbi:hypothetical protein Salat_2714100 [Sesamum alatum]|uniref:Uncharacterized protein n=1 Tax=Sesamum alatum TaxID=300844 RepID=A0AAE1XR39_9LAMI|nr:hypothetical protein Salat_2714100 [Sesamum alatum]